MPKTLLFLNENPLPACYTKGTISGKELRLRAAIKDIDEIHVVSLPGKPVQLLDSSIGELEQKIHIHLTPPWPYYASPLILLLWGLYCSLKYKPVVIEAESPILSGPAAILLGKITRKPVIVEVRASYEELIKQKLRHIPLKWKQKLLQSVLHFSYKNAVGIIANSQTYQSQLKEMGYESVVINPGLQNIPKEIVRQKSTRSIGYIGRLAPEKGALYLFEAVCQITDDLIKGHWTVIVTGDGILRNELEKRAQQIKKETGLSIILTGTQPSYQTLSKLTFLVNPCLVRAPLEMVNAEAAYMHVPVITFGTQTIPETVINNVSGLIVKEYTSAALAQAIQQLITNDSLREKLTVSTFNAVTPHYDFNHQVKKLDTLYHSLGIL